MALSCVYCRPSSIAAGRSLRLDDLEPSVKALEPRRHIHGSPRLFPAATCQENCAENSVPRCAKFFPTALSTGVGVIAARS
jgi:hypothetical protein